MKAGTTSLHDYLDAHPDISMSHPKELNFFSNERYWRKGVAWYERHFRSAVKVRGESSTSYTVFPRISHVPERMHALVPDAKLIYVVRDPVGRLVSHFVHAVSDGSERRSFSEVVSSIADGEPSRYVYQSLYFRQLEHFLHFYRRDQILVVESERLQRDREETLRSICGFLELSDQVPGAALAREQNGGDLRFVRNRWRNLIYPTWLQSHPRIPWQAKSPFYRLARIGAKPIDRPSPSEEETAQLVELFRSDVRELRRVAAGIGRNWLNY